MLNNYGEVLNNASLESYNTYGIKTSCKYLIKPETIAKLQELLVYLKEHSLKYLLLGKGSNVILPDFSFDGVVISLEKLQKIQIEDLTVIAEAGVILGILVKKCVENSLGGLEHLALIPGTLGGALYGNAGCNNHAIYDCIEKVDVIEEGNLVSLTKEEINPSYRRTNFMNNNAVIIRATFKLKKEDQEKMQEVIRENRDKRLMTQPLEFKNAGSVFKNPLNMSAGKLIDECGLKGYNINDAKVSEKHANFIINVGKATREDILELIKHIQKCVFEKFGVNLELEQRIIEW